MKWFEFIFLDPSYWTFFAKFYSITEIQLWFELVWVFLSRSIELNYQIIPYGLSSKKIWLIFKINDDDLKPWYKKFQYDKSGRRSPNFLLTGYSIVKAKHGRSCPLLKYLTSGPNFTLDLQSIVIFSWPHFGKFPRSLLSWLYKFIQIPWLYLETRSSFLGMAKFPKHFGGYGQFRKVRIQLAVNVHAGFF